VSHNKIAALWLKLLGDKPEHAGIGIMSVAFFVAVLGALLAFSATERNTLYWAGYTIGALGVVSGCFGIIYHNVHLKRRTGSPRNDA
jgi:hypothetical protein